MKKVISYALVTGTMPQTFVSDVLKLLRDGWELYGDFARVETGPYQFAQALVKYEQKAAK